MNDDLIKIGLYEHNIKSYKKIAEASKFDNIFGIVHATGTGKSYNALALAYFNKKKIIYLTPSNSIIEHLIKIIEDNPNLDLKRDFSNLEFRTYQSLINLSFEEIENINCDLLILDEFHHLGAPVWGARINTIIETHPNLKIFGMTAYTVRDRKTVYERDMANPDTNELFSNHIYSRYDLCDAMIDGVLPKPIYRSAYVDLLELEKKIEEKVKKYETLSVEYKNYMSIIHDIKRRIHEAPTIIDVIKKNVKPDGKYIYFCPPLGVEGVNNIEIIMQEAKKWFLGMGIQDKDIVFYKTTDAMGKKGKIQRDAFYQDKSINGEDVKHKLRVMFAINQYNEGVHAPNIDGVIMGRATSSDIVYFEQLGRALAVRGKNKEKFLELEKYSDLELLELCKNRDIKVNSDASKEELIERLLAPTIIDLANNFDYIKTLENELKERIKEYRDKKNNGMRELKIKDYSFDIEVLNENLYDTLRQMYTRLNVKWEDYYELAKSYYKYHGNLEVPYNFKTINGYEYSDSGILNLGFWIDYQRKNIPIESEKGQLLLKIGMRFTKKRISWEEMYEYAKIYYDYHKNLEIPHKFKTNNGFEYDDNGRIKLGDWIATQRSEYKKLLPERQTLLEKINMRFDKIKISHSWEEIYKYAKIYYEHHSDSEVPRKFETDNGFEYKKNGKIKLGNWIAVQRMKFDKLSPERKMMLQQIELRVKNKIRILNWEEMYEYAKIYYEHHGNLNITTSFKTNNGYDYDESGIINLGIWLIYQRKNFSPDSERGQLLMKIGINYEQKRSTLSWKEMYEYAKLYYEHHGNLNIPTSFKTNNGYDYDKLGKINLGSWLSYQRNHSDKLSLEKKELLEKFGITLEGKISLISWQEMYKYAKIYYEHYGNLEIIRRFRTNNGYEYDATGKYKLGDWIARNRYEEISNDRMILLNQIGMIWNLKKNNEQILEICQEYQIDYNFNKKHLMHISAMEFECKIKYLKEHNISVTDEYGKLHSIFSMSSLNMKVEYDISLEELILKYSNFKSR